VALTCGALGGAHAAATIVITNLNAAGEGFNDMLELRFSATIGGPNAYPDHWQQFTANLNFAGDGRFAFRYVGDAAVANYIGIDTVRVTTAVPEPTGYLMLGIGFAALALLLPRSRS
jgi:hypothetical protein